MRQPTVLIIVLVSGVVCIQAKAVQQGDANKQHENIKNKGQDVTTPEVPAPGPRTEHDGSSGYQGPLTHAPLTRDPEGFIDQALNKRGKPFGFMGSRGRRGQTVVNSAFQERFPLRRPVDAIDRLRTILGSHEEGLISQDKRKPHFGFQGVRG